MKWRGSEKNFEKGGSQKLISENYLISKKSLTEVSLKISLSKRHARTVDQAKRIS